MSLTCGLEWVVCLGCSRWAWKRLTYHGAYDSDSWPPAEPDEFEPVIRACCAITTVYEYHLFKPGPGLNELPAVPTAGAGDGLHINPSWHVVKCVDYDEIPGAQCPPYIIYVDTDQRELVLAVRGLNPTRDADYKVLLDHRRSHHELAAGYVHYGLLQAAVWLLDREGQTLSQKLKELGPDYKLVLTGHSLGSGIVALMAIILVNNLDLVGGIQPSQIHAYCIAPARCMSLNLAVKYADVITSVVLQDDFLPRTATPLEHIFGSIFCLPCLLFLFCLRDTFIPEKRKLNDPGRLYAPGRMYHIVERKFCRCGRYPPEVRTAIPVQGRFEHIVLSKTATSDHAIFWIEKESIKALELMKENTKPTDAPIEQKMEKKQSFKLEYKAALEKAKTLNIPKVETLTEEPEEVFSIDEPSQNQEITTPKPSARANWQELLDKLFTRDEQGDLVLKKDENTRR